MKKLHLLLSGILALSLYLVPEQSTAQQLAWHSFNEGIRLARMNKKPVILDFYADWCHWCRVMDRDTFNDPQVAQYLNAHYILIRINTEEGGKTIQYKGQSYTPAEFFRMLGGTGLPTVVFMDKDGNLITRIPGFIEKGVFLPLLGYIQSECYLKQVPFDQEYIEGKKPCGK